MNDDQYPPILSFQINQEYQRIIKEKRKRQGLSFNLPDEQTNYAIAIPSQTVIDLEYNYQPLSKDYKKSYNENNESKRSQTSTSNECFLVDIDESNTTRCNNNMKHKQSDEEIDQEILNFLLEQLRQFGTDLESNKMIFSNFSLILQNTMKLKRQIKNQRKQIESNDCIEDSREYQQLINAIYNLICLIETQQQFQFSHQAETRIDKKIGTNIIGILVCSRNAKEQHHGLQELIKSYYAPIGANDSNTLHLICQSADFIVQKYNAIISLSTKQINRTRIAQQERCIELHQEHQIIQQKQHEEILARQTRIAQDFTFQPKINLRTNKCFTNKQKNDQRNFGDRLYENGVKQKELLNSKNTQSRLKRESESQQECSFKPKINYQNQMPAKFINFKQKENKMLISNKDNKDRGQLLCTINVIVSENEEGNIDIFQNDEPKLLASQFADTYKLKYAEIYKLEKLLRHYKNLKMNLN